jgi:lipoprotein signal peptidase
VFDRITHGSVTDYLIFFSRSAINLADIMILAGICIALYRSRSAVAKGGV